MNPFSVFEEGFLLIKRSGDQLDACGIWGDTIVTVHDARFPAEPGDLVVRQVGGSVERREVVSVRFEKGMAGMPDALHLGLLNAAAHGAPSANHNTTYNIFGAVGAVGPGATANNTNIVHSAKSESPKVQATWTATLDEQRTTWKCKARRVGLFSLEFRPEQLPVAHDHAHLRQLVQQSQTVWGGWSLPIFRTGNPPRVQNRDGLIEGAYSRGAEQEVWQLFESGEFMLARTLRYVDDRGQKFIPYEDVVHGVAMGLVFAQRLYSALALKQIGYRFALVGVRNHILGTVKNRQVGASPSQSAGEDVIPVESSVTLAELDAGWRSVTIDVINRILHLFNAAKSRATIEDLLDKFIPRRRG